MTDPNKLETPQPQGDSYEPYKMEDMVRPYFVERSEKDENGVRKSDGGWFPEGIGVKDGVPYTRVGKYIEDSTKPGSSEMVPAHKDIPSDELEAYDRFIRAERAGKGMATAAAVLDTLSADANVEVFQIPPATDVELSTAQQRVAELEAKLDKIKVGLSQEDSTRLWRYAIALYHENGYSYDECGFSGDVTRDMANDYRRTVGELREARKA